MIPHCNFLFYMQNAVDAKKMDLAQRFIDKVKEWYSNSMSIKAAQNYLDSRKR